MAEQRSYKAWVPGSNPGRRIGRGRIAQLAERLFDVEKVSRSSRDAPTEKILMDKIQQFNQKFVMREITEIQPGWTVKVHQKIKEGGKERVAPFEGLVIARKHGKEAGGTFTVRRIISGIGVEKIFPLYSPTIEKIEVIKKARVRRAKLYYLREKSRKETRRKIKAV